MQRLFNQSCFSCLKFKRLFISIAAIALFMMAGSHPRCKAMDIIIDQEVFEKLDKAGDQPVSVIITCEDECSAVHKALRDGGINVTGTDSMILGSLAAQITKDQLPFLKTISGISAIEYDREAKALE